MLKYAIKNKDGKYIRPGSRFIGWHDLPNAQFYDSKEQAENVIDYFYGRLEDDGTPGYNAIEYDAPFEICGFEVEFKEVENYKVKT